MAFSLQFNCSHSRRGINRIGLLLLSVCCSSVSLISSLVSVVVLFKVFPSFVLCTLFSCCFDSIQGFLVPFSSSSYCCTVVFVFFSFFSSLLTLIISSSAWCVCLDRVLGENKGMAGIFRCYSIQASLSIPHCRGTRMKIVNYVKRNRKGEKRNKRVLIVRTSISRSSRKPSPHSLGE